MTDYADYRRYVNMIRDIVRTGPETLTLEQANMALAALQMIRHDDEVAHSCEDELRDLILCAVAAGHPDSIELARVALRTSELEFVRWCA